MMGFHSAHSRGGLVLFL